MPRLTGESYVLDQPLYDTVQLAAVAGNVVNFFSVPRGGVLAGAVIKTLQHTNLIQAGVLESHNLFTITGCSMFYREQVAAGTRPTFADLQVVQATGFVELFLGNVSFLQLPAAMIPAAGAELNYYSNIAAAATEFKVNRGVEATQNRYHLSQPIEMLNQESLRVQLTVAGTIAAVTDLSFVLWGNLVRPVR